MRYSPFRHINAVFHKKRPLHCTVFLTRRCNAACPFCFYLAGQEKREPAPELTTDEIRRLAASMGSLLWLAFSGGEIFLRPDLEEIASIFYEKNRPAIILLPTNGLRPDLIYGKTKKILQRCPKSTVVVKLSLDGPAAVHDTLRGVRNAFERVWETFHRLERLERNMPNLELGFNSVLCSASLPTMTATRAMIQHRAPGRTHTISLVRGDLRRRDLLEVDAGQYRQLCRELEEDLYRGDGGRYRFAGARLKAAQDVVQRRRIWQAMQEQRRTDNCHAGRLSLVISECGDVYPCESFTMKMGNLRDCDFDVARLCASPRAGNILDRIAAAECQCTHECYHMLNIFFSLSAWPELLREYWRMSGRRRALKEVPAAPQPEKTA